MTSSPKRTVEKRDPQTYAIIGAAMEVHAILGPGLLEAVYHEALEIEIGERRIPHESIPRLRIRYKGRVLRKYDEPDFLVYDRVGPRDQGAIGARRH